MRLPADPVLIYKATSKTEAWAARYVLVSAGVQAFVAEEASNHPWSTFGALPDPFNPRVWVDRADFEGAKLILQDHQRRSVGMPIELRSAVGQDEAPPDQKMGIVCEEPEQLATASVGYPPVASIYCGLIYREIGKAKTLPQTWVQRFARDALYRFDLPPEQREGREEGARCCTAALPSALVHNFRAGNLTPVDLLPYFKALGDPHSEGEHFELDHSFVRQGRVDRGSRIDFHFSSIGFHNDHALLSYGWTRGPLWGRGLLCLLRRQARKWAVCDERQLWIS